MFEEISETMVDAPLFSGVGFLSLLMYFVLNTAVVFSIIRFLYYPKSKRRDYFFTFMLICRHRWEKCPVTNIINSIRDIPQEIGNSKYDYKSPSCTDICKQHDKENTAENSAH